MKRFEHLPEIALSVCILGIFLFLLGATMTLMALTRQTRSYTLAEMYNISTGAIGAFLVGIGSACLVFSCVALYGMKRKFVSTSPAQPSSPRTGNDENSLYYDVLPMA